MGLNILAKLNQKIIVFHENEELYVHSYHKLTYSYCQSLGFEGL